MMFLFTFFHFSSGFMLQTTEQLSAFPLRAAPKKAAKVKTPKLPLAVPEIIVSNEV
jgi:hypothetical protein